MDFYSWEIKTWHRPDIYQNNTLGVASAAVLCYRLYKVDSAEFSSSAAAAVVWWQLISTYLEIAAHCIGENIYLSTES